MENLTKLEKFFNVRINLKICGIYIGTGHLLYNDDDDKTEIYSSSDDEEI